MNKPFSEIDRLKVLIFCDSKCIKCESKLNPTPSHIVKTNTGKKSIRGYDYSNFQNVVCMCASCHAEFEKLPVRKKFSTTKTRQDFLLECVNQEIAKRAIKRIEWLIGNEEEEILIYEY